MITVLSTQILKLPPSTVPNVRRHLNAGEDLLVASADKPFRFPATFTFVVRSFTVLDGIGKGLDPRFDISEIAAPYARGLLLEGNPQYTALAKDFRRRVGLQVLPTLCILCSFLLAPYTFSMYGGSIGSIRLCVNRMLSLSCYS